jgi:hypothetical protein
MLTMYSGVESIVVTQKEVPDLCRRVGHRRTEYKGSAADGLAEVF